MSEILQFRIKQGDREILYTLKPLEHAVADEVYHTVLTSVAAAFRDALGSLVPLLEGDTDDLAAAAPAIGAAVASLDYKTVKFLTRTLLTGAVIQSSDSKPVMGDLCDFDFTNMQAILGYYRDHPNEKYVAIFKSIGANYPGVFTEARAALAVIKRLSDRAQKDRTE